MRDDIDYLLSQLTWEEKVSLLAGSDYWQTQEISRLGIGSLKTSDGPAGARGKVSVDGEKAVFLPAPILQASTWSKQDVREIGRILCREAKTKAAQVILAPTVCCARNPLGGRNFECYGEDPLLSGYLAIEYVAGLQETGEVAATVKHFVGNEQESDRFNVNAIIEEQPLRELYLRPFEIMIKSNDPPLCLMTSYNLVNGEHMDSNHRLLTEVLRGEWGFEGLVMSDWGGMNSTSSSVLAGCDLEMPGPSRWRGTELLQCVDKDDSSQLKLAIDRSVGRLLNLKKRLGLLGLTESDAKRSRLQPETSSMSIQHNQTLRSIAANGIVLLKNSASILPLDLPSLHKKQVAFIGPNARIGTPGGGGSASMNPQYISHPMNAFKQTAAAQGVDVDVVYSQGSYTPKWLPLLSDDQWNARSTRSSDDKAMLKLEFFPNLGCAGQPVDTQYLNSSYIELLDNCPSILRSDSVPFYSWRLSSTVTPKSTGVHQFGLSSVGNSRLYVNDELIIDNVNWTDPGETFSSFGSAEIRQSKYMAARTTYSVTVESFSKSREKTHVFGTHPSLRLGFLEEMSPTMISDAIALADSSEFAIVVLGLDAEWESEGYDRKSMELPGSQNELAGELLRRAKHPERIVFVNQSGCPLELPWADDAASILQMWYGGQEGGNALADVLLGSVNPSGHLPVTWPVNYSDLSFADEATWPGTNGQVLYGEGVNVGYRWFLKNNVAPRWWFGHGETYTSFSTELVDVKEQDDGWLLAVNVENAGGKAGQHVLQLYGWLTDAGQTRHLVSFEKTPLLSPGASGLYFVLAKRRDMAHWIDGQWVMKMGVYTLGIGKNVGDEHMITTEVRQKSDRFWSASE